MASACYSTCALKVITKTPQIIALTASVMNEEVAQLRQSGFNGAIAKPLSFSTFPALMERIANGETVWHIA